MDKKKIKLDLSDITIPGMVFVAVCLTWEGIIRLLNVPIYLLPPPSAIFLEIIHQYQSLLKHTGITMLEAVLGFIAANSIAFLMSIMFAHSRFFEKGFYPYAIALKTTPIVAMAPLLVLWLGTGIMSKIAASSLICFFPMLVNTLKGLKAVDPEALDLFDSLSASKWQILKLLRLPNSLPYLFSALKISTTLSVVGAIVGEFVGANSGLGYLILTSSYHLETPAMFSAIIASAVCGVSFFGLITWIERKTLIWQKAEDVQI